MKDLCIVGFGLAGLSMARHAELSDLSFDIISDRSQLSSRVAGGIINPVAVKRMKPVWNLEYFLDYAKDYYAELASAFDNKIYSDKAIQVFIHNTEQKNNWYEAYDKPRLKPYLVQNVVKDQQSALKAKKSGFINAGIVDLPLLFKLLKAYYVKKQSFKDKSFTYNNLVIESDITRYEDQKYRHIVFCEGFGVCHNPFFNNLDIYGNKGDYLIIKSKNLNLENIVKSKYFLIPLGNDLYKFGATYQRQTLDHTPSEEAELQMKEALDKMIDVPYQIIDQVCGIRPTTKDRRPIVGTHNKFKNLHLLNGFGSRGVMTSPKLGKDLLDHILKGKTLDKEISIDRIYARIQAYN